MQTAIRHNHDAQRRKRGLTQGAVALLLALGVMVSGTGCITAPPKKISAVEKAREENAVGIELAHQFESKLRYRTDSVVEKYLTGLAKQLADASADPRLTSTGVAIIQDRSGQWRSYSLPGRKTYLSLGLLQKLQYDNEAAAVIALEFGNLMQSHALNHLKKQAPNSQASPVLGADAEVTPPRVDFFSPDGLFSFDLDEVKASIKSAVEIMYKTGFDSRGLIQVWGLLRDNPEHSPFPDRVLEELSDYTRATISMYAPLRNPIVGKQEFQSIRKRIQKL